VLKQFEFREDIYLKGAKMTLTPSKEVLWAT
jgi:hypothetical protein